MLPVDYQTTDRMQAKLRAIPLPELSGKRVLDLGCEAGFWSRLASDRGAIEVLGIDRGREVRGVGYVDLAAENEKLNYPNCHFQKMELGKQWFAFGQFDVILCLSVYHHAYEAAGGNHESLWFWFRRHLKDDGQLLWEGPVSDDDGVVRVNVGYVNRDNYTRHRIFNAASRYFHVEYVGPALHSPTREVWCLTPKPVERLNYECMVHSGAGGATRAFQFDHGRRIAEVEKALGVRVIPGSFNVVADKPFHWNQRYYRAQILDVEVRGVAIDRVKWEPRWAKFYPVTIGNTDCFAFRFEGERYPLEFVELLSATKLRDKFPGERVELIST